MKKVLLVAGHTYPAISVANKEIVKELAAAIPGLVIDDLFEEYPDFKIDVKAEQQKLLDADVIIIQSPLFWYSASSLIMRWWEETMAHGWAYGSTGTALKGKKILFGITAGAPTEVYTSGACGITDKDILNRFKISAGFCNMEYLGGRLTGGLLNAGAGKLSPEALQAVHEHVEWIVNTIG